MNDVAKAYSEAAFVLVNLKAVERGKLQKKRPKMESLVLVQEQPFAYEYAFFVL